MASRPYGEQYRALMDDCYGWADFWSRSLSRLGFEVWEPVANARPQQERWAEEMGASFTEDQWLFDIVLAQIRSFAPDVLFINDHHTFNRAYLERVRAECPSIRAVVGWCGAPYVTEDTFRAYDLILTNVRQLFTALRDKGYNVRLCRHGFAPVVLDRLPEDAGGGQSFSFVGSVIPAREYHTDRLHLLARLREETPLAIWTPNRDALVREWADAGDRDVHGPLFGLEMYSLLRSSRATLNSHIDISLGHASNMRLFEATGVGGCLVTDRTSNLAELFEEDEEVVTYGSPEEAVEKVRYLLDHPKERDAIAAAGQRRTLRDHSFDVRAQELDRVLRAQV